eukprot:9839076-Alexandrium_andersonii.AAC.1
MEETSSRATMAPGMPDPSEFAKAPPCARYEELRVTSELAQLLSAIEAAHTESALQEATEKLGQLKSVLLELQTGCKEAGNFLKRAQ